jgi:uncharacterized protein (UPF0305 family)
MSDEPKYSRRFIEEAAKFLMIPDEEFQKEVDRIRSERDRYEALKQQLREIHHYYYDSGSDQKCAKRIVNILEDHFPWLRPED